MRDSLNIFVIIAGLGAMLAGCGSGSSLTTGSLFGSSSDTAKAAAAPPPPKPATPTDRAVYVAANVARAQRCGYFFEPAQVRANFLAAEAQAGTPPDQIQKISTEYDSIRAQVAGVVAKDEGYCTEARTRDVKAALTRQLAGDFNPPQQRQVASGGTWLDSINQGKGREVFNPEGVFDQRKKTTRASDD